MLGSVEIDASVSFLDTFEGPVYKAPTQEGSTNGVASLRVKDFVEFV